MERIQEADARAGSWQSNPIEKAKTEVRFMEDTCQPVLRFSAG